MTSIPPINGYEALGRVISSQVITCTAPTQATTATLVTLASSQMTTATQKLVSYQVTETGGVNGVKVQLQGSIDDTNFYNVGSLTTISAGATALLQDTTGSYQYYRLQIEDATGGSHGSVEASGFAK